MKLHVCVVGMIKKYVHKVSIPNSTLEKRYKIKKSQSKMTMQINYFIFFCPN
jgi:hypothetical protein